MTRRDKRDWWSGARGARRLDPRDWAGVTLVVISMFAVIGYAGFMGWTRLRG